MCSICSHRKIINDALFLLSIIPFDLRLLLFGESKLNVCLLFLIQFGMGIYLSTPKTEKFSEDGENERLRYGLSSMQGWRATMEDAVSNHCESC